MRRKGQVLCPSCEWPLSASYRMPAADERMACCGTVLVHQERVDLLRQLTVARSKVRRAA